MSTFAWTCSASSSDSNRRVFREARTDLADYIDEWGFLDERDALRVAPAARGRRRLHRIARFSGALDARSRRAGLPSAGPRPPRLPRAVSQTDPLPILNPRMPRVRPRTWPAPSPTSPRTSTLGGRNPPRYLAPFVDPTRRRLPGVAGRLGRHVQLPCSWFSCSAPPPNRPRIFSASGSWTYSGPTRTSSVSGHTSISARP